MNKVSRKFTTAFILSLVFVAFTALVKFISVEPIGPNGSEVGLAGLNQFFNDLVNSNTVLFPMETWYKISKLFGLIPLASAGLFAVAGLVQLIRRKSLKKVHYTILLLAGLYAVLAVLYVLFDKLVINFRPVLEADGTLESSYPSTHAMLSVTIMATAMIALPKLIKNRGIVALLDVAAVVVMLVVVVGRMLSGVHWFTDILGGVLIGAALTAFYAAFVAMVARNIRRKKKRARRAAERG